MSNGRNSQENESYQYVWFEEYDGKEFTRELRKIRLDEFTEEDKRRAKNGSGIFLAWDGGMIRTAKVINADGSVEPRSYVTVFKGEKYKLDEDGAVIIDLRNECTDSEQESQPTTNDQGD